jgi:iron-sulfur cluster repair protein YtfE (RIC family)
MTTIDSGLAELGTDTLLHIHEENNLLVPGLVRAESEMAASPQTS